MTRNDSCTNFFHSLSLCLSVKRIKDEETRKKVKLTLVGSVRNEEDEKRVETLKEASIGLNVSFHFFTFLFLLFLHLLVFINFT